MFLFSDAARGIPNLVARAYVEGVQLIKPCRTIDLVRLLMTCLVCGQNLEGDDSEPSISREWRDKVLNKLGGPIDEEYLRTPGVDLQDPVIKLSCSLECIDVLPEGGDFLKVKRTREEDPVKCSGCEEVDQSPDPLCCSVCTTVTYCSKECQSEFCIRLEISLFDLSITDMCLKEKDWKIRHQALCYKFIQ